MKGLTGWDTAFVVLALLQFLSVAALGFVVGSILGTLKKVRRRLRPALTEVRALSVLGKSVATHTRDQGQAMAARLQAVATKVKSRVVTTKRIFSELKPQAEGTGEAARLARDDMVRAAKNLGDLRGRLARLRVSAGAALKAARDE